MALGLGGISVKSELNQPLTAEIPVYVSSPAEAESLAVKLASADEFSRVGLNIGEISVPITFEVGKNARGEPVIQVSSAEAIREPFVTFLVEVNWANGRLLREYSVLLEPPISSPSATIVAPTPAPSIPTSAPAATPVAETQVSEPESIAPEPIPAPIPEPAPVEQPVSQPEPVAEVPAEPVAETPAEAPAETPAEPVPEPAPAEAPPVEAAPAPVAAPSASEYGPIATGETLWEIASTTRPNEAVTINQMMLALLRANPNAFYQDNVNALKRGAVLRIPGSDELVANGAAEAAAEILSQNQTWIGQTQTSVVADADADNSSRNTTSTSRSSTSSRVQLVPPTSGDRSSQDRPGVSGGTGDSQALRQELARTKEDLASKSRDNQELSSRVKELEKMTENSDRLMTIANSQIKALKDQLAQAQAAREAAEKAARDKPLAADTTPAPTPDPVETVTAEPPVETTPEPPIDPATDPAADPAADPLATTDGETTTDTGTETEPGTDPVAETATDGTSESPTPVPLPEEQPATDTAPPAVAPATDEQPFYMNPMVWGGGLAALLLAGLAIFGLRRKKSGTTSAPATSSLARSPLSDAFAGGVGGASGAAGSGDPEEGRMLAELSRDPTDLNAHLSLLEHYYTSRNIDKFEAQAEAMYAQVPSTDIPEWQGALLMGRDLCPSHPLFSEGDSTDSLSSGNISDPFGLPNFSAREPAAPPIPEPDHSERDQFGFDLSPPKPAATPPQVPASIAESFDFNLIDSQKSKPSASGELSLDFELDKLDVSGSGIDTPSLELPSFTIETTRTAPPESTIEMPRISDEFLGDDAVATKLDLARAYLDMGDSDGAKSMLDEVMAEGNDKQKDEARKLLTEIR